LQGIQHIRGVLSIAVENNNDFVAVLRRFSDVKPSRRTRHLKGV